MSASTCKKASAVCRSRAPRGAHGERAAKPAAPRAGSKRLLYPTANAEPHVSCAAVGRTRQRSGPSACPAAPAATGFLPGAHGAKYLEISMGDIVLTAYRDRMSLKVESQARNLAARVACREGSRCPTGAGVALLHCPCASLRGQRDAWLILPMSCWTSRPGVHRRPPHSPDPGLSHAHRRVQGSAGLFQNFRKGPAAVDDCPWKFSFFSADVTLPVALGAQLGKHWQVAGPSAFTLALRSPIPEASHTDRRFPTENKERLGF